LGDDAGGRLAGAGRHEQQVQVAKRTLDVINPSGKLDRQPDCRRAHLVCVTHGTSIPEQRVPNNRKAAVRECLMNEAYGVNEIQLPLSRRDPPDAADAWKARRTESRDLRPSNSVVDYPHPG